MIFTMGVGENGKLGQVTKLCYYINIMRYIDTITRKSVDAFLSRIDGRYPIVHAILYGSRARGDAVPDSDADVALVIDGPKRRTMDVALEMSDDEMDVLMETGVMVSALPIWLDDWNDPSRHANPFLIANIKREGIAL
jgi:uncharacterized protein